MGSLMPTFIYASPTGFIEPSGDWHNPARVFDGNWDNFADVEAHYWMEDGGRLDWWSNWLTLTLGATRYVDRVRLKSFNNPWYETNIQILNQSTGVWDTIIDAQITQLGQVEIAIPNTLSDRLRIRASLSGVEYDLYELDYRYVVSDVPDVPPPQQNEVIIIKETDQSTSSVSLTETGCGARVRSKHRTTRLEPVIIG